MIGIFRKYYNKWFVHTDSEKIMWDNYSKIYKISWMLQIDGVEFKEIEFEKYRHWGPWYVFCIKHISEFLSVE